MKTVTNTILASLFGLSLLIPASANTLSELTTEVLTKQLTELQESIKTQTKQAIENTAKQLAEQFNLTVATPAQSSSNAQAIADKAQAEESPQAEEE